MATGAQKKLENRNYTQRMKRGYKTRKSTAQAVAGSENYKPVNTKTLNNKPAGPDYSDTSAKNVKTASHPPYNKDMSNRITVKDETPAPSYMKATKTYDAETMKTSVYDGGWDPKKAEEESQKNKSNSGGFFSKMFKGSGDRTNADNAIKSAQSLLDRSLRKKK